MFGMGDRKCSKKLSQLRISKQAGNTTNRLFASSLDRICSYQPEVSSEFHRVAVYTGSAINLSGVEAVPATTRKVDRNGST